MPVHREQQQRCQYRKKITNNGRRLSGLRIGHLGKAKPHGVTDDFTGDERGRISDLQCETDRTADEHFAGHKYKPFQANDTVNR